ncbi:outer membrane beta-barrel protein [Vibrio algicola]|uniref:Outer membrane beta-barrel protein n=1 Tax=Vibrio algicola TaxID=2662262 RepID=A0A5Q0THP6_9VIBR|nr:outer membrane beta-barrel protein [Vibrio algicola]
MIGALKWKKDYLLLLGCMAAAYSMTTRADSRFQDLTHHIDPLLGLDFTASLTSDYGYNDNVLYQKDSNIIGSNYYSFQPSLSMEGHRNTKDFGFYYQGDYRNYTNNQVSADSYADHQLSGVFNWELGLRHHVEFEGNYGIGHEARGEGVTRGFFFGDNSTNAKLATFDAFNIEHEIGNVNTDFEATYTYGAKGAKGNILVNLGQKKLDYDILNSYAYEFQDYLENEQFTETHASINFRHHYTDKTRFDYTLMYRSFDYLDPERCNDEYIALFSIISQLTGKSKIAARVYYLDNKMPDRSITSVNWDVMYKWQPVDYSSLVLKTLSVLKDPDNTGDYIQSYQSSIALQHQFLGHVSSQLAYHYVHEKYQIRKATDQYNYVNFSLNYLFRPKVKLTLDYKYSLYRTDDSTNPAYINGADYQRDLGYKQNEIGLSVNLVI